jgi:hypothetical protein
MLGTAGDIEFAVPGSHFPRLLAPQLRGGGARPRDAYFASDDLLAAPATSAGPTCGAANRLATDRASWPRPRAVRRGAPLAWCRRASEAGCSAAGSAAASTSCAKRSAAPAARAADGCRAAPPLFDADGREQARELVGDALERLRTPAKVAGLLEETGKTSISRASPPSNTRSSAPRAHHRLRSRRSCRRVTPHPGT